MTDNEVLFWFLVAFVCAVTYYFLVQAWMRRRG